MDKKTPIIHDALNQRIKPSAANEVVDPAYVLSRDPAQQLVKGPDNGVLAKGLSLAAAYPASGDLCDIIDGQIAKDSYSVKMRYADPLVPGGWADMVKDLPMATATSAGMMSGSDKETLDNLVVTVSGLSGSAFYLNAHSFTFVTFSADPTELAAQRLELTEYALAQLGLANLTDVPANTSVHNINGRHLFRLNAGAQPMWVDDGIDVVATATNVTQGIVKGSAAGAGKVSVESDGSMSVIGWAGLEKTANKVTSIGAVGSDTNYPTEKATATALAAKENAANKTATVRDVGEADNANFPTELAVASALAAKEDASNKTPTVDGSSTDDQYPTAKAVNDAIEAHTPKGGASAKLLSAAGTRQTDLATNYNYTVPTYVVGADQLVIYLNGLHCAVGQQYLEIGATGTDSSTIQILHPLRVGDSYNVYVW